MKWSEDPVKRFWQQLMLDNQRAWAKAPDYEKARLALRGWKRRTKRHQQNVPEKPSVVVLRAQGKRLMVLRVGPDFVSSFTWDTLMFKAAHGHWKKIADTTLAGRLPED